MYFKQIYKDDPLLPNFLKECADRGYKNNSSIESLKFDYFESSAFFAGIQDDKIKVFGGVHNFDFDGHRYWRVCFRSVTLYDDKLKPSVTSNFRKSSLCVSVIAVLGIKWVEERFGKSQFIITSNDAALSVDTASRSHSVDKLFRRGRVSGISLLHEKITYLNTIQNVWLIDREFWLDEYAKIYANNIRIEE